MLELTVNEKNTYKAVINNGEIALDGTSPVWDAAWLPNGMVSIICNGKSYTAIPGTTDRQGKQVTLTINGNPYTIAIKEPIDQLLQHMGIGSNLAKKAEQIKAPMPGMVLKVLVSPGQQVNKGDGLLILEAMKMENMIKATAPGTIKAVKVGERAVVEKGVVMIEME